MAWFLPVLAAGTAASLLFSVSKARAAGTSRVPTIPQPAQSGQRRPPASAPPAGTPLAVVDPFCVPDVPPCNVGMRLRTGPGVAFPTVGQDGDPRHAFTGELVGVLEQGLGKANRPAGSKEEWWHVVTAGGGDGFTRAIDPEGNPNFAFTGEKAGQPVASISGDGGACCDACAALPVVISGPGDGWTPSSLLANVARVCAAVDRAAANGTLPATFANLRAVLASGPTADAVKPLATAYLSRLCGMLENAAVQNNLPAALDALQMQYLAALQKEREASGLPPLQGGGANDSGMAYVTPLTRMSGANVGAQLRFVQNLQSRGAIPAPYGRQGRPSGAPLDALLMRQGGRNKPFLQGFQGANPNSDLKARGTPQGAPYRLREGVYDPAPPLGVLIARGVGRGLSPAQATTEAYGALGQYLSGAVAR